MSTQGDKAKVSEHIKAPELRITVIQNIRHIRVRLTPIFDARLTKDLPGSVLTFQHSVLIFTGMSLTRKSRDFGDYCMCQQYMGSELSNKHCQYPAVLGSSRGATHASGIPSNRLKCVGDIAMTT